jgi:glycine/D-amino acid oxidase-like deaminating enzyme/nitrite reductase/ring-hydroxylating ferredoxin subunit
MERDGQLRSLWQEGVGTYQPKSGFTSEHGFDVLIVGGGITGLTSALLLQQAGKKCILAEARHIGFGTTGGTTAHLNTMLDTPYSSIEKNFGEDAAQLMAEGCKEAIHTIQTLSAKFGIEADMLDKQAVFFAETDSQAKSLDDIYNSAIKVGVAAQPATDVQMPVGFKKAYNFPGQAQIHPLKYITGLAAAFEQLGGVIAEQCMVKELKEKDGVVAAHTSLGDINAQYAIYATHVVPGVNIFSFRCAPYRSYVMAFTLNSGDYPTTMIYDAQDPYHYIRSHEVNGRKYVIAGGHDHKTGHTTDTEAVFTKLEAYVREYFDVDAIAYKWSSQYYESVDGLPYIGHMPGHDNVFVATGFGGNGMILGTLSGKILSDIIISGNSPYKELLSPGRIKFLAGMSNFIKENADVISMFIGKRLSYEHVEQLADMGSSEARVIEYNGAHIALYKDAKGRIYALDPVCPHAKCIVVWNGAEKSWDCPCHGARYAIDGTLLNGPATKGLTPIDWSHL